MPSGVYNRKKRRRGTTRVSPTPYNPHAIRRYPMLGIRMSDEMAAHVRNVARSRDMGISELVLGILERAIGKPENQEPDQPQPESQ